MTSRVFDMVLEAADRGLFPKTRKWGWQRLYNLMSRFWTDGDWRFMNYGYLPPADKAAFPLDEMDEPERAFIGLYFQAVDGVDLAGKRVLEVGCGRGGGTAYVAKYHGAAKAVGVDYSPVTVKRAQTLNGETDVLSYAFGDAEKLPFEDGSFDVVVNIESSHCYSDMDAFLREVARVLTPGGSFTWADMRGKAMMPGTDASFEAVKALEKQRETVLSPGVVAALDQMNERKVARIAKIPLAGRFFKEFAGTKGSALYKWLKNGEVIYLARVYRKVG